MGHQMPVAVDGAGWQAFGARRGVQAPGQLAVHGTQGWQRQQGNFGDAMVEAIGDATPEAIVGEITGQRVTRVTRVTCEADAVQQRLRGPGGRDHHHISAGKALAAGIEKLPALIRVP